MTPDELKAIDAATERLRLWKATHRQDIYYGIHEHSVDPVAVDERILADAYLAAVRPVWHDRPTPGVCKHWRLVYVMCEHIREVEVHDDTDGTRYWYDDLGGQRKDFDGALWTPCLVPRPPEPASSRKESPHE